jgi:hypothetical protein
MRVRSKYSHRRRAPCHYSCKYSSIPRWMEIRPALSCSAFYKYRMRWFNLFRDHAHASSLLQCQPKRGPSIYSLAKLIAGGQRSITVRKKHSIITPPIFADTDKTRHNRPNAHLNDSPATTALSQDCDPHYPVHTHRLHPPAYCIRPLAPMHFTKTTVDSGKTLTSMRGQRVRIRRSNVDELKLISSNRTGRILASPGTSTS